MKKNEKIFICILVTITIILLAILFIRNNKKDDKVDNNDLVENTNNVEEEFIQVLDDGTKLNTSSKLNETKTVDGLEISNIQLTNQNEKTVLLADVKNNSGKDIDETFIDITLLDKTGAEIITVQGLISPMKNGESSQLNTSMTLDYSNAYDFTVTIQK